MIQLYTRDTPTGKKVSIILEKVEFLYEVYPVNLRQGEQMKPEYLAINPNNKIPAIIDTDGPGGKPFTLFESGAILMYLAEKSGKLWPQDMRRTYRSDKESRVRSPGSGDNTGHRTLDAGLQTINGDRSACFVPSSNLSSMN